MTANIERYVADTNYVKEWVIRPMRRKSKAKTDNVLGIKHRDLVSYTPRGKSSVVGYVTALYPNSYQINITSHNKQYKKISARSCMLKWRFNKIYWLEQCI